MKLHNDVSMGFERLLTGTSAESRHWNHGRNEHFGARWANEALPKTQEVPDDVHCFGADLKTERKASPPVGQTSLQLNVKLECMRPEIEWWLIHFLVKVEKETAAQRWVFCQDVTAM